MDRRNFLRKAGIAAGLPHVAPTASRHRKHPITADPLLEGVCDIHICASPDVKGRTVDELGLARRAKAAGYRAVMFKSNVWLVTITPIWCGRPCPVSRAMVLWS